MASHPGNMTLSPHLLFWLDQSIEVVNALDNYLGVNLHLHPLVLTPLTFHLSLTATQIVPALEKGASGSSNAESKYTLLAHQFKKYFFNFKWYRMRELWRLIIIKLDYCTIDT